MRRTFQALARAADVKDIVTRSVSRHSTEEMQRHYSRSSKGGFGMPLPVSSCSQDIERYVSRLTVVRMWCGPTPTVLGHNPTIRRAPRKGSLFLWALKGLNLRLPPCE